MGVGAKCWILGLIVALAAQVGAGAPAGQKDLALPVTDGRSTSSSTPQVNQDYVIGVSDNLDVSVWKDPDLGARGIPVRPDGKITLPLIGDVAAQGFTPGQLAANIADKLRKYMSDPRVDVTVAAVNSRRYYVLGEVVHAGPFPLLNNMTVLQALSTAGGVTQFAKIKSIYVLRVRNGQQEKLPFNYKNVVKGRQVEQNIVLEPGDTIMVP